MCKKDYCKVSFWLPNDTGSKQCLLDPQHRFEASTASVTRLSKQFNPAADLDAILMEFRDYQSLPEDQMPTYTSLEEFWACMGEQRQPGGEICEKRF